MAAHRAVPRMTDTDIDQPELLWSNVTIQVRDSGEGLVLLVGLRSLPMGLVAWWTMKLAGIGPTDLCCRLCYSKGVRGKVARCQAAMLQEQGPEPQCADRRRPEASSNREGIAVHGTRHPGTLWPVAARQKLSRHLEEFSWRTVLGIDWEREHITLEEITKPTVQQGKLVREK